MLVLAIDTSTPLVTAGLVTVDQPHEVIARLAARTATAASSGAAPDRVRPATQIGPDDMLELIAERSVVGAFAHAEQLMPLVMDCLREAGRTVAGLDAIVVGLGPGPFTGLRVGMATAAALGDGLDRPVHGVPGHDGTAAEITRLPDNQNEFLVITDARRREVYLSAYARDGKRIAGPLVIAPASVKVALEAAGSSPTFMVGAGAELLAQHLDLPIRPPVGSLPRGLVSRALRPLLTGVIPGPLTPLYLRRPDATEPGVRKSVLR